MTKSTEQRLIFILIDNGKGELQFKCDFFPRLALSEESFAEMPSVRRNLQAMATNIAKVIMDGMQRTVDAEAVAQFNGVNSIDQIDQKAQNTG